MLDDLIRRTVLFDSALVHHHDPVGELERFFLIVRDENAGQMDFGVQPAQPPPQLLPDLRIERAERFVEQQHPGLDGQRARQRDSLPLPARQLRRVPAAEVIELHERQQIVHFAADLALGKTDHARTDAHAERHVLENRHVPEQRIMLEDESDAAIPRIAPCRVVSVEQHRSRVGPLEAGNDAQERRLAGARRSQQRQQLALLHGEADVVQRGELPELLREAADFDAHGNSAAGAASSSPAPAPSRYSTMVLTIRVTIASTVSSDATANAA